MEKKHITGDGQTPPAGAGKQGSVVPGPEQSSLDPSDWESVRTLAHKALDRAIDFLRTARDRPVWQPVPREKQEKMEESLPAGPQGLEETYREFEEFVFPYSTGNTHPRFWGWVHGSGTVGGIVSEMLAAAMNSNCGGRDHGAIYVERCVINWCKQMFGYPESASGLLVSGTSMGTLIALTVARNSQAAWDVRKRGVGGPVRLKAYTSDQGHESIIKAIEILGLGNDSIRKIPVDDEWRMDLNELSRAIIEDRQRGEQPFCVVGTAGTVNTAALDDLQGISQICRREGLWFHVDGAFGALCVLHEMLRPRVAGIELADSIAFDFHKWIHVPYDAGCVLVRDGDAHWKTFTMRPPYLQRNDRGLAGGGRWFCEFGPELSRGFRALKIWFCIKEHGTRALGEMILKNCRQAQYLASLVRESSTMELLAQPTLNIVCFRFRASGLSEPDLDSLNQDIVADLQEKGIAAPSTTRVRGKLAIRVAITNHRSSLADFDEFTKAIVTIGTDRLRMKAGCINEPYE